MHALTHREIHTYRHNMRAHNHSHAHTHTHTHAHTHARILTLTRTYTQHIHAHNYSLSQNERQKKKKKKCSCATRSIKGLRSLRIGRSTVVSATRKCHSDYLPNCTMREAGKSRVGCGQESCSESRKSEQRTTADLIP